jgi:flagellar M-ring protein FliF
VQAIVHLVASSVPGLAPDGVSVVDQAGRLLSSAGGDPVSEASGKQLAIQQQIENRYAEALEKLLTPLVGAGNFTAEVHADVDFAEVQATRESYPKDTAVVRREEGSWTTDSANGSTEPGGVPGALSNQAPPPADIAAQNSATPPGAGVVAGGAAATGAKTSENYNRSYDIGREVSITKQPVGTVKRLSVAVALKEGSKKLSKTELATLENLVKGAVGFDQARGDMIALSARKFAEIDPEAAGGPSWWEAGWVSMLARNLSALGIVALIVFGIAKPLMKRRAAAAAAPRATASPRIRNEIAAALQQEQRIAASDPNRPVTLDMIEAAPGYSARAELIRNFVRQDPARAALVVRDLIRADMPGDDRNG